MAGGRGTRLARDVEKPLTVICGKTMLERVVGSLKQAEAISEIFVVVSRFTPKTRDKAQSLGYGCIETLGSGYVEDTVEAIRRVGSKTTIVIAADLPLLTAEVVSQVLNQYNTSNAETLAVYVPNSFIQSLGLSLDNRLRSSKASPAGINVLNGEVIGKPYLAEEVIYLQDEGAAVNVNTEKDIVVAEKILRQRGECGYPSP